MFGVSWCIQQPERITKYNKVRHEDSNNHINRYIILLFNYAAHKDHRSNEPVSLEKNRHIGHVIIYLPRSLEASLVVGAIRTILKNTSYS